MKTEDAGSTANHDPESLDDRLLADVLDDYLAEIEAGREVDVDALIRSHPAIADRLRDCLGVLRAVSLVAEPGAEPLPDQDSRAPLGDYRIIRQVGRGGMGIVYEAEQLSLGRRVALKILPFASSLDPSQLARFKLEAQAAAQLHHAHIVPIHAIGSERGVHFYAMQFIDGRTLDSVIADLRRSEATPSGSKKLRGDSTLVDDTPPASSPSTFPSNRERAFLRIVAELGIQAAEALDHAHRLGVVHRDIKPANLILDDRGHLWIADFGLALVQASPGLTSTGNVLGTLRYMSPEQALARRDIVDHRADIYSLGATLYELLTLRPIFEGDDRPQLLLQIERDEPRPPRRLNPSIPEELETIVLKALYKEPARRYATAKDLADDLRRHLDNRPILARRPTPSQRVAKWVRRHQAATASTMAVLLISTIVLSVALTLLSRKQSELVRKQSELVRKQAELVREHDEAVRQGDRATNNFWLAHDAVSEMLTEVGDSSLRNIPRAEPIRRALLEKALAFFQRMADEKDNPHRRFDVARAYRRIADIDVWLGRHAEAANAVDRSIEILEGQSSEGRPDRAVLYEIALAEGIRGRLSLNVGDRAGAEKSLGRSVALFEDLKTSAKDSLRYRKNFAGALMNQMVYFLEARRFDEMEKAGRGSLEIYKELLADSPEDPELHSSMGGLLHNLALVAQERRDNIGARDMLKDAIGHQKAALSRDPTNRQYRNFLRNHLEVLAQTENATGNFDAAIEAFKQDITIGEGLVADFPDAPINRRMLAGSLSNLALMLNGAGRSVDAERELRRATVVFEALAAEHPGVRKYEEEAAMAHTNLAVLLSNRDRTVEAAGEYCRAIELYEGLKGPVPPKLIGICADLSLMLAVGADPKDRNPAQALEFARKAVGLAPRNGNARAALGASHYASGDWAGAILALRVFAEHEDGIAMPFFILAMAHHRLGDQDEAREWFELAVARMKNTPSPDKLTLRARADAVALLGIADPPVDKSVTQPAGSATPAAPRPN